MTLKVGALELRSGLFVAPMAGINDRPFRRLACRFGAALAVSEMLSSRPELRDSRKTRLRMDHAGATVRHPVFDLTVPVVSSGSIRC